MEKITQEVAEALVADLIIEAEAGAASNDPMLARASRNTLAIAGILELVLTGAGPAVSVDNTLSDDVAALKDKVAAAQEDISGIRKDTDGIGDAVSTLDNRVTAVEAHYNADTSLGATGDAAANDIRDRIAALESKVDAPVAVVGDANKNAGENNAPDKTA